MFQKKKYMGNCYYYSVNMFKKEKEKTKKKHYCMYLNIIYILHAV